MIDEPLLTVDEAIALLRLPSRDALYKWRRRHHIPNRARGRALRFFKSDLLRPSPAAVVVDFRAYGRQHAHGER